MKKFLALILALAMIVSVAALAGCGESKTDATEATDADQTDAAKVASVDDLPGAVIGVQMGTTGDIFASDYEAEGSTIERYNKGADAVLALIQGKVDCVIIDNEPAKAFVAANEGLKILDDPFAVEEYAICISKDRPELTAEINSALAELKADGTIQSIIDNYIGDETKGKTPYESPADVDTSKGTLRMATNAFFEPYEYYVGDDVVGIDADIAQAVCDKLGYELVIDDMDFETIITAVQSGKSDFGMAGMTVTEERLQSIDFTDTYTTATQVIIVKE